MRHYRIFVCTHRLRIGEVFQNTALARGFYKVAMAVVPFSIQALIPPVPVLLSGVRFKSFSAAENAIIPELLSDKVYIGIARRLPNGRGWRVVARAFNNDYLQNQRVRLAWADHMTRDRETMQKIMINSRSGIGGNTLSVDDINALLTARKTHKAVVFPNAIDVLSRVAKNGLDRNGQDFSIAVKDWVEKLQAISGSYPTVNIDSMLMAAKASEFPTDEQWEMARKGINPHHPMTDIMFMYPETLSISTLRVKPEELVGWVSGMDPGHPAGDRTVEFETLQGKKPYKHNSP
jgi:hypothetical protein